MSRCNEYKDQVIELDFLYPSEGIHRRWDEGECLNKHWLLTLPASQLVRTEFAAVMETKFVGVLDLAENCKAYTVHAAGNSSVFWPPCELFIT